MERTVEWLVVIPLAPLLAAVINVLVGKWWIRERAHWLAVPAVGLSFLASVGAAWFVLGRRELLRQPLYTWIVAGNLHVPVELVVDELTAVMLLVVTGVSFLVHVYSIGYMKHDPGYYRFFAWLPLFVFSMVMLVLASNFLVLFVFWEAVGLCSYLLIGFWFRRRSAAEAAKKAFIVNRIGDLGFALGLMLLFTSLGTLDYEAVFHAVAELPPGTATVIALLLFIGAIGKSAQLPLFVWLPDAMEGPTPVSALIHAATMVTAGIFMVARAHPLFLASPIALWVVAAIGALTAFVAATIATTQFDIKRVIAYSTVSQLGYMAMALGVGAWVAAIFHLFTHAFFKALLFLGSGAVMHALHDELDMRRMGGLKRWMPLTYWTFVIGAAANAGLLPLAGFWSKDEILVGAWVGGAPVLTLVGLAAAFFTSLYMFRAVFLTFHGQPRFDPHHLHPHDPPPTMAGPLVLLALGAALAGFVGVPPENGWIHHVLEPVFETAPHHKVPLGLTVAIAAASTAVAIVGAWVAYAAYVRGTLSPSALAERLGPLYRLAANGWYFDESYRRFVVRPLDTAAHWLWRAVDVGVIDGTVNGLARIVTSTAQLWRRLQTGLVANYALVIALGTVLLVGAYLAFSSTLFR
ncbi:MAG: NADH-quinone oxidoreductase subunit L [Thermomicrobium sp.]|nr:NADH-quinone oxidoreductase subunit L [Thermomicrobium sp.]